MSRATIRKRVGRALTPLHHLLFRALQPMGFHLTRNHYYSPVPDTRSLSPSLWSKQSEMVGVNLDGKAQIQFLNDALLPYIKECNFSEARPKLEYEYHLANNAFEALDAEVLHCVIRHFKSKRIVEIGSGYSTRVSARAALMNQQQDHCSTELTCIEPYPSQTLRDGFPGLTTLLIKEVQEVDPTVFEMLEKDDILFIDSSHVAKVGSDVVYEYLELLPRLRPGVLVHIHDIFLPFEYPREWILRDHVFWTEQYLLQAFLTFNTAFEVLWASSFMSQHFKGVLERAFPSWRGSYTRMPARIRKSAVTADGQNVWPASFWIRRIDVPPLLSSEAV